MAQKKFSIYPLLILALVGAMAYSSYLGLDRLHSAYRRVFPDVAILKTRYPVAVAKKDNRIEYRLQRERPAHWRALKEVSRKAVVAVLMAEDSGFYQHHGFEPEAMKAAWEHNHRLGAKVKRGGSTITQQVAKNLFLSHEKTLTRKFRELLLAVDLERELPKGKILEIYLNIAEWGPGVYGIEQAARRHFGKSSAELSAWEGAVLAFMLPNPKRYQNSYREGGLTEFGSRRVATILERMWRTGYIDDEEYASSLSRGALSYSL